MTGDSRHLGPRTQAPLPFPVAPRFDRALFVVSDGNREAVEAVDAWPAWTGGSLALIGPEGVGKSHLARAWADKAGALIADDDALHISDLPSGPVLVEDVDRRAADTLLFHLINRAAVGGTLLVTARTPPKAWPLTVPDLRSRVNAMSQAVIAAPDDTVLGGVLQNLFRQRNIRPEPELLDYLLRRMERSAPAALDLVVRLDTAAHALGRGVTRALAREVLEFGRDEPEHGD